MEPTTIEEALARIAERPDDAELFQTLGRLYLRAGRFAESRAAYERSLELAPDDPWTHLYLGNWCYYRDRLGEALRWFRRAAELLPDEAIAYVCQGTSTAARAAMTSPKKPAGRRTCWTRTPPTPGSDSWSGVRPGTRMADNPGTNRGARVRIW